MVVYLAGPITGNKDYKKVFAAWEETLTLCGYTVLNPAHLPLGMKRESYMPICMAMIDQADTIAVIPGWESSKGVAVELKYAEYQGKGIRCL